MIERYTLPRMGEIWSEENKFKKWLEIEIAACEAWFKLGKMPEEAFYKIKDNATFNPNRILDIEKKVDHDVIAFLTNVGESVGSEARFIHMGLTSSDIVDTALSLLMVEATDLLIEDIKTLTEAVKEKAREHKDTVMIGRTHGIHAEPITFGFKLAVWWKELERGLERLERIREIIRVGKLSGPVGTFSNIDPYVEEYVCNKLKLNRENPATQVVQRDRHAEYLTALAVIAGSIEKFATEIRALQRTELTEVEEPFGKEQKGSSAMPHKKNPITCERLTGLARVIRANALVAVENIALWHERDISHSSTERIIIPDSTILLDYMLQTFTRIIKNLLVYPENMKKNIEKSGGLVFSQRILLNIVDKGLSREEAYKLVQNAAMEARNRGKHLKDIAQGDFKIRKYLSTEELNSLFDLNYYLRHLDAIFKKLGL